MPSTAVIAANFSGPARGVLLITDDSQCVPLEWGIAPVAQCCGVPVRGIHFLEKF
jgi:hypothetical protein